MATGLVFKTLDVAVQAAREQVDPDEQPWPIVGVVVASPLLIALVHLRVVGLLASLLLAGCSSPGQIGQVDGWSIGVGAACAPNDARCLQMIEVATERLDERDAGHAPIVQVSVHVEGMYPNDDGSMGEVIRSGGPPEVVVFVLADGSRRAIGVKYVLGRDPPTPFDHGPERRGGGGGDGAPAPTI